MSDKNISTTISLFSSSISGALHIFIGYPFDTIKTLYQQNNFKYEDKLTIRRLFQGIRYPLIQTSMINSTCFGLNNYFLNICDDKHSSNIFTAVTSTIILTPFDKFKILSQCNIPYKINIPTLVKSFRNFHVICLCEIPSTFLYFSVYQHLKEKKFSIFTSGGIAGMASWVFTYPIDTIKTRMQNETCHTMKQAFLKGGLYKGLSICLFRSFIVNGVNFYSYEKIANYLINVK